MERILRISKGTTATERKRKEIADIINTSSDKENINLGDVAKRTNLLTKDVYFVLNSFVKEKYLNQKNDGNYEVPESKPTKNPFKLRYF